MRERVRKSVMRAVTTASFLLVLWYKFMFSVIVYFLPPSHSELQIEHAKEEHSVCFRFPFMRGWSP